jgi:hypothetical protein
MAAILGARRARKLNPRAQNARRAWRDEYFVTRARREGFPEVLR